MRIYRDIGIPDTTIYLGLGGSLPSPSNRQAREELDRWVRAAGLQLGAPAKDGDARKRAAEEVRRYEFAAERAERLERLAVSGSSAAKRLALRAEAERLERLADATKANDEAGLWLVPPARNRDDGGAGFFEAIEGHVERLRGEAEGAAESTDPPVKVRRLDPAETRQPGFDAFKSV